MERLFLDKNKLGFWDDSKNSIIESLYHDEKWNWQFKERGTKRYGLFCLASLLLSKEYNNLDLKKYDDKIKRFSQNIYNNLSAYSETDLSYGALLAVILANKFGYIELNGKKIENLLISILDFAIKSHDNQNSLILIPASFFLLINKSREIRDRLDGLVTKYLSSANKHNMFATGDLRFNYHQRNMYILWGLLHASQHVQPESIYNQAKRTLKNIWENRRQKNIDDAFLWHPKIYLVKNRIHHIYLPILSARSSIYLFECHQTFFANAINFFNRRFNDNFYLEERDRAMSWIFGKNRMHINLLDVSNLGIPARIMTTDHELIVKDQKFKGSYEIGSYILELSFQL